MTNFIVPLRQILRHVVLTIYIGKNITRGVDVDLISRAIRGIAASNVPFAGAISTLSDHVSGVRNNILKWAAGAGVVAMSLPFIPVTGPMVGAAVAYGGPVITGAFGGFAAGGVRKHWELKEVKDCKAMATTTALGFLKELTIFFLHSRRIWKGTQLNGDIGSHVSSSRLDESWKIIPKGIGSPKRICTTHAEELRRRRLGQIVPAKCRRTGEG